MTLTSLSAAAVFTAAFLSSVVALPPESYCLSFYGQLHAQIDVPDAVPKKNFDGKECPRKFSIDSYADTYGGILHLCPPGDSEAVPKGARLRASMLLGGGPNQTVPDPSVLWLQDLYITGGNVSNSDRGDLPVLEVAKPAYKGGAPRWSVNGTQSALVDSKDSNSSAMLNCRDMYSVVGSQDKGDSKGKRSAAGTNNGYCGTSEDVKSKDGCWGQQNFELNSRTPLNFSIEFDREEVIMEFSITGEYMEANKTGSGTNTTVSYSFKAGHAGPSEIGNFWDHASETYDEVYKYAFRPGLLKPALEGNEGLPVFVNKNEANYAFENGTFFPKNGYAKDSTSDEDKDSGATKILSSEPGLWISMGAMFLLVGGMDLLATW